MFLEGTQKRQVMLSKNELKVNFSSGLLADPITSRMIFQFQSAKFELLNSESILKNNVKIEVG
jgi:hypothetical protein